MKPRVLKSLMGMAAVGSMLVTTSCAMVDAPQARNANIPSPMMAKQREAAVNERPDSVMYLPLGEDVLVPEVMDDGSFPKEVVGPYEFRGETLASALQMVLSDYDLSLAFETQEGLSRRITVSNLRGDLGRVINQMCSLANLYCSYEDGGVTVKDTQTFTVTLPPIGTGDATDYLDNVAAGLAAIIGGDVNEPIVDPTTRTIIYSATQRTSGVASRYFQRLRANTAMIVFETYIWEVSLNSGNSTGVDWTQLASFGKYSTSFDVAASVAADFTSPISIGLPTTQAGSPTDFIRFLSQFGAVKTISQPQITVLSGSSAELRVADTQNYVSQIATTLSGDQSTTSVSTDSVDTGFTLTIGSSWDKSTVYANVAIELTDVKQINDFSFSDAGAAGGSTSIQLPQTSERQLTTQIRVRPGDSVLIGGLVRENDNFNKAGLGMMEPILPTSRTTQAENLELVIMMRPRVIIYTASNDKRYVDFADKKHTAATSANQARVSASGPEYVNVPASGVVKPAADPVILPPVQNLTAPEPLSAAPMPEAVMPVQITQPNEPASVTPAMVEATSNAATSLPSNEFVPVDTMPVHSQPISQAVPSVSGRFGDGYVSRPDGTPEPSYAPSARVAADTMSASDAVAAVDDAAPMPAEPLAAPVPEQEEMAAPVYFESPTNNSGSVYPAGDYPAQQSSMPSPAVPLMDSYDSVSE